MTKMKDQRVDSMIETMKNFKSNDPAEQIALVLINNLSPELAKKVVAKTREWVDDIEADTDMELSPTSYLRVLSDGCLYSGTCRELVTMLYVDAAQWTGDPDPETWMRNAAERSGCPYVRSDTPEHFIADMVWRAHLLEPIKREYHVACRA
jgi:hypothetical protein